MNEKPEIMVVDDDATVLAVFATALKSRYAVSVAGSGDEALEHLARRPGIRAAILDVAMPGIDGYETCRRIKANDATAAIPVIFVSAQDSVESRLKGYDAGGEDYIVKPFEMAEVAAKLAHLIQLFDERAGLKQVAESASSTAMTAMTSLGELGVLVDITKRLASCEDLTGLADGIVAGIGQYGLTGTAQVREPERRITRSGGGQATPLETSIIDHMAEMGDRIVQFKSRMVIHFEHVSMLVHDLPVSDAERSGRLRDHLAMLMEAAESRCLAIRHGLVVRQTIRHITAVLGDIDRSQRHNRAAVRLAIERMTQRLEQAYASVALSTDQEDFMNSVVSQGIDDLIETSTDTSDIQGKLSLIVNDLRAIATDR
jgi:CheY-like chemotaxis protein